MTRQVRVPPGLACSLQGNVLLLFFKILPHPGLHVGHNFVFNFFRFWESERAVNVAEAIP